MAGWHAPPRHAAHGPRPRRVGRVRDGIRLSEPPPQPWLAARTGGWRGVLWHGRDLRDADGHPIPRDDAPGGGLAVRLWGSRAAAGAGDLADASQQAGDARV